VIQTKQCLATVLVIFLAACGSSSTNGNGTTTGGATGGTTTGGTTGAPYSNTLGRWIDTSGDVYISESGSNVIRFVPAQSGTFFGVTMQADDIYTIAGNRGVNGSFSGDAGPAANANFSGQVFVALDSLGNLYAANQFNYRIRMIARVSGTYFGVAMSANDIYTIAGNDSLGYTGDGGPAALASLRYPEGIVVDPNGNVIVSDWGSHVVRLIAARTGTYFGVSVGGGNIATIAGNGNDAFSGDGPYSEPPTSAETTSYCPCV
jgi:hypothetical protein